MIGVISLSYMYLVYPLADRFHEMSACPGTYYVTVIEDLSRNAVIGTTSTIIEQKFIHSTSKVSMRG